MLFYKIKPKGDSENPQEFIVKQTGINLTLVMGKIDVGEFSLRTTNNGLACGQNYKISPISKLKAELLIRDYNSFTQEEPFSGEAPSFDGKIFPRGFY